MYTNPEIGTIFPAQPNTTVVNPGAVVSGTADALNEWLQAQAQQNAYDKNQILVQDWTNTTWNGWLESYSSARVAGPTGIVGDPDAPPPTPPPAFVVVVFQAPAGGIAFKVRPSGQTATQDSDGYETAPGTGPYIAACDPPIYTKIAPPQKPGTGKIKS